MSQVEVVAHQSDQRSDSTGNGIRRTRVCHRQSYRRRMRSARQDRHLGQSNEAHPGSDWTVRTGTAALITDLKHRGLLNDPVITTLSFCGVPSLVACLRHKTAGGRDHNPYVFTSCLCGDEVHGGTVGESDQWGYKPMDRDSHAGSRHPRHHSPSVGDRPQKLTVRHNGVDR